MLALGVVVAAFYCALTTWVPPLLPDPQAAAESLPRLTCILPFLVKNPFVSSLVLLAAGGITVLLAPSETPLRTTAWILGGALLIGLWGTLLVFVPQCHSVKDVTLP